MKMIIIAVVLGLVSFGGSFLLTQLLAPEPQTEENKQSDAEKAEQNRMKAEEEMLAQLDTLTPKERTLEDLIRDVKQKLEENRRRDYELDEREKRIEMAQEQLKKEAQKLEGLRVELASPLLRLKKMKEDLQKSRVIIRKEETHNLKRTAKIYEKMPPDQGGRFLVGMCNSNQFDDAAKILVFMSEKNAARVMAAITDAEVAAQLFERMKRIRKPEEKQEG